MSTVSSFICVEKKYSYQHIQGVMLVNLNKLAFEFNLSHSVYRVAGFLISNYNINANSANPSIDLIANGCKMSKSTIIKSIETLVNSGLIIAVKQSGKLARYFFTKKLLAGLTSISCKTVTRTVCKTPHDIKPNKKELNKTLCSRKIFKIIDVKNISIKDIYCKYLKKYQPEYVKPSGISTFNKS